MGHEYQQQVERLPATQAGGAVGGIGAVPGRLRASDRPPGVPGRGAGPAAGDKSAGGAEPGRRSIKRPVLAAQGRPGRRAGGDDHAARGRRRGPRAGPCGFQRIHRAADGRQDPGKRSDAGGGRGRRPQGVCAEVPSPGGHSRASGRARGHQCDGGRCGGGPGAGATDQDRAQPAVRGAPGRRVVTAGFGAGNLHGSAGRSRTRP